MRTTEAGPGLDPSIPPAGSDDESLQIVQEPVSGALVPVVQSGGALSATERAQIDMQVTTAKQYPRSITKALQDAESLACLDEETADSMLYAVTRGNKVIEGPSVRLAEIMAYSWSNLRVDADIVGEDRAFVTAMALCWDLEKNVGIRIRVRRRITNKNGGRYNDDMIGVASNAALSIAVRNGIFKVIPHTLTNSIYRKARVAALGKGGTLTQKRQALVAYFGKLGVKPEEIFTLLDVKGLDDIMEDQLVTLRGLANAIKEGEQTVETTFRSSAERSGRAQALNDALEKKEPSAAAPVAEPSVAVPAAPSPDTPPPVVELFADCIKSVNPKHKRCVVEGEKVVHTPVCPHYSDT